MAGIYIHIPFCSQICHYCDFYKTANLKLIHSFVDKIILEIEVRKNFLIEDIDTIYYGGGTPSSLPLSSLSRIHDKLQSTFKFSKDIEITIEVNPDDVSLNYYNFLKSIGFNRVSIGIQSFNNSILHYLNRKHSSEKARQSILLAYESGITNISCDLIYGIQIQTITDFKYDLGIIKELNINHLSAYHLGIEEGTYFGKLLKNNKLKEISEEKSEDFFNFLSNWSETNGYEHYEISNFATSSHYSKHNTNYWFGKPYLGLGPSAHSFDGANRFFNISNLNKYLLLSANELLHPEIDLLTLKDRFNEFILLRLRTKWGISLNEIERQFSKYYSQHVMRIFPKFEESNYLRTENSIIYLTKKGFFASDFVVRELFIT